jgi:hypothetical protein
MNACRAPASISQSGKRRREAYPISAQSALAASELALLLDDDVNAADWLHMSVCKNKCLLLCTLAALNECVSASTRRETSRIDRPLRLAARGSRTPTPCSAVSASSAVRILLSARSQMVRHLMSLPTYKLLQKGQLFHNGRNGRETKAKRPLPRTARSRRRRLEARSVYRGLFIPSKVTCDRTGRTVTFVT